MNLSDEMRRDASKLPLIVGLAFVCIGMLLSLAGSAWSTIFYVPVVLLIGYGFISYGTMSAFESASAISEHAAQNAIQGWDGE